MQFLHKIRCNLSEFYSWQPSNFLLTCECIHIFFFICKLYIMLLSDRFCWLYVSKLCVWDSVVRGAVHMHTWDLVRSCKKCHDEEGISLVDLLHCNMYKEKGNIMLMCCTGFRKLNTFIAFYVMWRLHNRSSGFFLRSRPHVLLSRFCWRHTSIFVFFAQKIL